MATLANKYRPSTFDDVTEQKIVIDILKKMCSNENLSNRNFLFTGPAGTGKAQPLYSKVLTLDGYIRMGDIEIGTEVYTHTGSVAKVTGIYPQGELDVYSLFFNDGSEIDVSIDHLNIVEVYDEESDYIERVLTTRELLKLFINGYNKIYVPNVPNNIISVFSDVYNLDNNHRYIQSIRYKNKSECQCIYVDHEDHTYITDFFIPTHNTTTARIIAKELNGSDGGEIIEIDAASHNGVDSVKEIVAQARTYPIKSKYKIFVIDECHTISSQGWQVLLKILEEVPAKSIFIFCTTNPEKIPATITSRVQTFQLSKISLDGIVNRLKYVIECENNDGKNISYDEDAINLIAKLSNGGMRDALTLLDKVLVYSNNIHSSVVELSLNLPNYDDYFELLSAYSKKDNECVTSIINKVYNSGVNFVKWFEGFHSFIINVVKFIYSQDINITTIPNHYLDKISNYSTPHVIVCLKLSSKLFEMISELKRTQYLQEVALTYLYQIPKKK